MALGSDFVLVAEDCGVTKPQRCPWCDQIIRLTRSKDISRRFNAHVTWMTRELHGQMSRAEVYIRGLLKAVEISPPPGGAPYRYKLVTRALYPGGPVADVADPVPTSDATNKELMTACEALHFLAGEWEIGPLPERTDWIEEEME